MSNEIEFEIIKRTGTPGDWRDTTYRKKDGSTFRVSVPPRRSDTGLFDWDEEVEARMRDRMGRIKKAAVKLLRADEMEYRPGPVSGTQYARAWVTVKAACERLARVEKCPVCEGSGRVWSQDPSYKVACPDCKGTGLAFEDWKEALRSLTEEK